MKYLVMMALAATGCAEKIGPSPNDNPDALPAGVDAAGDAGLIPTGKVTTITNADGSSTSLVDSSSMTDFTHVDIDGFTLSEESGPWDLRFQRFHIAMGTGVQVAPLTGTTFDAVTTAPTEGFMPDPFETDPRWYDYDPETHVLTPRPFVWVIKSPTATIKLTINEYYDTAGSAGWFTVTWRNL
jgi:hypothetical protein